MNNEKTDMSREDSDSPDLYTRVAKLESKSRNLDNLRDRGVKSLENIEGSNKLLQEFLKNKIENLEYICKCLNTRVEQLELLRK